MVNYDDLPLFPLHVVLYPEMPLPLHIFEPRYREMIWRCREEDSPFGIALIQSGEEAGQTAISHSVGTTARLTHYEEMPDGRMIIVATGETRFRVLETRHDTPYATARVAPFWEQSTDPLRLQAPFDTVIALFKAYLKSLFALANRPMSALQLPQEPERLSYAIASVLQIPLSEKQQLLEMTATETRLGREIEILRHELESLPDAQATPELGEYSGSVVRVNTDELSKLSSRN